MWGRLLAPQNTGRSTKDQIKALPVKRRGSYMDHQGRLVVVEIRKCPATGLTIRRTIAYS